MPRCSFLLSAILIAVLQAIPALAQSPTNLAALQGLVSISALSNTETGKATLAANLAVTAAVQDDSAKQPLLLPFREEQQQALRDAYITDGNAYELADGLGTGLSRAYWSLTTFQSSDDGKTSSFTSLSPAVALLITYTNRTTRSDSNSAKYFFGNGIKSRERSLARVSEGMDQGPEGRCRCK